MLNNILKKIGLNKKEAQVYLSLLELGSQPASVIGKKADINRSTTYLILESLISKGYANQHVRADVKYFSAADPETIIKSLESKEKEIEDNRKSLVELLPEFYALTNPLSIKPKVKFYEGEEGVKHTMHDSLTSTEPILSWSGYNSWLNSTPGILKFANQYARERVTKYKIPVKLLAEDNPTVRKYLLKDYPSIAIKKQTLLDIRWIPKSIPHFENEINIYNDKVSIVSLAKNELLGIIIESHEITKTLRAIFHMAWMAGKKN